MSCDITADSKSSPSVDVRGIACTVTKMSMMIAVLSPVCAGRTVIGKR